MPLPTHLYRIVHVDHNGKVIGDTITTRYASVEDSGEVEGRAFKRLVNSAIKILKDGKSIPCVKNPERWNIVPQPQGKKSREKFEDVFETAMSAALQCQTCPALEECKRYSELKERPEGVLAGVWSYQSMTTKTWKDIQHETANGYREHIYHDIPFTDECGCSRLKGQVEHEDAEAGIDTTKSHIWHYTNHGTTTGVNVHRKRKMPVTKSCGCKQIAEKIGVSLLDRVE